MAQPWERQKGEKNLWFDRFTRFRLMGPDRSLLAIYNEWQDTKGRKRTRTPATSWRKACDKWQWRKRAEAWDKFERQRGEAEYEAERLEWRGKRRKLLQGFFGRLGQALRQLDPTDATLGQLTQAVRVAVQELRAEFDDEPTAKHDVTVGLDEPTRQLLAPFFALAARYVPADKMDEYKNELEKIAGGEDA